MPQEACDDGVPGESDAEDNESDQGRSNSESRSRDSSNPKGKKTKRTVSTKTKDKRDRSDDRSVSRKSKNKKSDKHGGKAKKSKDDSSPESPVRKTSEKKSGKGGSTKRKRERSGSSNSGDKGKKSKRAKSETKSKSNKSRTVPKKDKKVSKSKHQSKGKKRSRKSSRSSSADSHSRSSSASSASSSAKSAGAVFRAAANCPDRSSQDRLIKYSKLRPGRLAAANLQKWDAAAAKNGDDPVYKKGDMPACAVRFFTQVIKPEMGPGRNRRELEVIAHAIDALAHNNREKAADILTQRMMAVKLASETQNWERAQYIELVPPDSTSMIPRAMRTLANREEGAEKKANASASSGDAWPRPRWQPKWEDGKGQRGKGGKNLWGQRGKGQGKDKGGKNKKGEMGDNQGYKKKPWEQ